MAFVNVVATWGAAVHGFCPESEVHGGFKWFATLCARHQQILKLVSAYMRISWMDLLKTELLDSIISSDRQSHFWQCAVLQDNCLPMAGGTCTTC